ncbi:NAB domain-containing protein, partial [Psidium guajava]
PRHASWRRHIEREGGRGRDKGEEKMMLQRAASNAYSWWWASHIRTKQSKWLEQNLQDMEEKVQSVLQLIEEDGDSFAKRAEMYYKKRPELISFVGESYQAYRALAERYDHISTELQNANNTIASVFPEQVPFSMDEDDEDTPRRPALTVLKQNIPKVPKAPVKDLKSILTYGAKKMQNKRDKKAATANKVPKSGLSKAEALEKIDRNQKDILALQTVKEFVKSSYESGLARYWETEKQIKEMQEEVSTLQDEFGEGMVIEDDVARSVMATAALKSCQETLVSLQEKQQKFSEEARAEQEKIKIAREKFKTLKEKFLAKEDIEEIPSTEGERSTEEAVSAQGGEELKILEDKIKQHIHAEFSTSLTVSEMAEKIDELVNKVIVLETAVSSQTALIERLRAETSGLQTQFELLEDDNASSIDGSDDLQNKMQEMERKLHGVEDLNRRLEDQDKNLSTHFTEARCNLEHLSNNLGSVRRDEEQEAASLPNEAAALAAGEKQEVNDRIGKLPKQNRDKGSHVTFASSQADEGLQTSSSSPIQDASLVNSGSLESKPSGSSDNRDQDAETTTQIRDDGVEHVQKSCSSSWENSSLGAEDNLEIHPLKPNGVQSQNEVEPHLVPKKMHVSWKDEVQEETLEEEEPNWKELFLKGLDNREQTLLTEYTTVLRNFKEAKKKLTATEKKTLDGLLDTSVQLRDLKNSNAMKDEEILSLRQKLNLLQTVLEGNSESIKADTQETEDIKFILADQAQLTSEIEEKFRMDIDQLLEENLEFWLRFSSALHQIQNYETAVEDLQAETMKLLEKEKKKEGSRSGPLKSDVKPIYKHLREIQNELTVWLEKFMTLKDE